MKVDRKTFFDAYRDKFGSLTPERVKALGVLLDAVDADEWEDPRQLAYLFATAAHETAWTFRPIKEYRARAGSKGRANQDRYWLTGFYGRGFVQLTWKRNYQKASTAIGADLVSQPDLALDPAYAYQIAAAGMREGWFTGKKLSDYISSSRCDYVNARKIINGLDKAEQIAGHARKFEAVLKASLSESAALAGNGAAEGAAGSEGTASPVAAAAPQPDEKSGEPTPDKAAQPGTPIVGARPEDRPEGSAVVEKRDVSVMSRVTAALAPITTFATAIGLKVGGVQLTNGVIVALVALLVVGLVVGAVIYERSKQRAHEKTLFLAKNRADASSYNVEIK